MVEPGWFDHWCQRSDDLAEDVRMWRNFVALAPFALDRPEPTVRIPMQRSRTAAEAERLLFERMPHTRRPAGFPRPLNKVPRPGGPT